MKRRSRFELEKAEKRAHIIEGLKIALAKIDLVIKIIKASKNEGMLEVPRGYQEPFQ